MLLKERLRSEQIEAALNYEIVNSCGVLVILSIIPPVARVLGVYEPYYAMCIVSALVATTGLVADRWTSEKVVQNPNYLGSGAVESNPFYTEQPSLEEFSNPKKTILDAMVLVGKILFPPIGIGCGIANLRGAKGNLDVSKALDKLGN